MKTYFLVVDIEPELEYEQVQAAAKWILELPEVRAVRIHQRVPVDKKQMQLFGEERE